MMPVGIAASARVAPADPGDWLLNDTDLTGSFYATDPASYTLGVEFYTTAAATLTGLRFYADSTTARTGAVWRLSDGVMVSGPHTITPTPGAPGWAALEGLSVPLTSGVRYRFGFTSTGYGFHLKTFFFTDNPTRTVGVGVLPNSASAYDGHQGSYVVGGSLTLPNDSYQSANYFADVRIAAA